MSANKVSPKEIESLGIIQAQNGPKLKEEWETKRHEEVIDKRFEASSSNIEVEKASSSASLSAEKMKSRLQQPTIGLQQINAARKIHDSMQPNPSELYREWTAKDTEDAIKLLKSI